MVSIITEAEHEANVAALAACLAERSGSGVLDKDYAVIDLIVSLAQGENKIENAESAQKLYNLAKFYLAVVQQAEKTEVEQQEQPIVRPRERSKSKTRAASKPRPEPVEMTESTE